MFLCSAMSHAARSLCAVLREVYEEDWYDPHTVNSTLNVSTFIHFLIVYGLGLHWKWGLCRP